MPTYTICHLCHHQSTLAGAVEIDKVPCNVRQFKDEFFTLWRCVGCGCIHCAEEVDLATYYANYPLNEHNLTINEHIGYGNRFKLIKRHGFCNNESILDYGCGSGNFVNWLCEQGLKHVSGYDAFVQEYNDATKLNASYDVVTSYDVIEHDDDPVEFLKRVGSLVRSGGLLIIGTPNADNVSLARKYDPALHPPYHRHILSEQALLFLAKEQGFEAIDIYRRSYYDTLFPTVNSRFMWSYIAKNRFLDVVVGPPNISLILRSPDLWFLAFFGYFLPRGDNIIVSFRKR